MSVQKKKKKKDSLREGRGRQAMRPRVRDGCGGEGLAPCAGAAGGGSEFGPTVELVSRNNKHPQLATPQRSPPPCFLPPWTVVVMMLPHLLPHQPAQMMHKQLNQAGFLLLKTDTIHRSCASLSGCPCPAADWYRCCCCCCRPSSRFPLSLCTPLPLRSLQLPALHRSASASGFR